MITIKKLKEEVNKFPDDAECYAYEGEVTGLIVTMAERNYTHQGVIHCSEHDDSEKETELLSSDRGE